MNPVNHPHRVKGALPLVEKDL
ncbi:hypothetical protein Gohar_027105 [Gossypium harknessii]|uniref:Uncharacterized protein n=2 Tax=Gossypium harknessii TaxID=34285 RepID=A0A7J9HV68_9ROSI|nr:hypothetical protein [Gossypium harknessii]